MLLCALCLHTIASDLSARSSHIILPSCVSDRTCAPFTDNYAYRARPTVALSLIVLLDENKEFEVFSHDKYALAVPCQDVGLNPYRNMSVACDFWDENENGYYRMSLVNTATSETNSHAFDGDMAEFLFGARNAEPIKSMGVGSNG